MPLTPALRSVLDLEARRRRETYVTILGWLLLGFPLALVTGMFGGGGGFLIICLIGAAIGPLIVGTTLWRFDQVTRRRAEHQTYVRSTGALTLRIIDGGEGDDNYQVEVCGNVLPIPDSIDLRIFGVSVNSRGLPTKDGTAKRVVGTVEHDIDCQVILTIADAEGQPLYRHPDLPRKR